MFETKEVISRLQSRFTAWKDILWKHNLISIFGVFGALGVFYVADRKALGSYRAGAIANWFFWLALNLVYGFTDPNIGIVDHIGGLVAGIVFASLLVPRSRNQRESRRRTGLLCFPSA